MLCKVSHFGDEREKANRIQRIMLRNNRSYCCPVVALMRLAIRKKTNKKALLLSPIRHCHFQDRNICSVVLSHSLPQPPLYWYCHFGNSICSVTLYHPPSFLSLHSSSFCPALIHLPLLLVLLPLQHRWDNMQQFQSWLLYRLSTAMPMHVMFLPSLKKRERKEGVLH